MKLSSTIGEAVLEVHFQRKITGKPYEPAIPKTISRFLSLMEKVYQQDRGETFSQLLDTFAEEIERYLAEGEQVPSEADYGTVSWDEMRELEEFMDEYNKSRKG